MGNKRRKASIIIISVLLAVCALFPVVFVGCFSSSDTISASDNKTGQKWFGNRGVKNNCEQNWDVAFTNGTYMIVFFGQNGNGSGAGYGATCLAFFKGSTQVAKEGFGGGSGAASGSDYNGGGYTEVTANFALPSTVSASSVRVKAGGGGGGYYSSGSSNGSGTMSATSACHASFIGTAGSSMQGTTRGEGGYGWSVTYYGGGGGAGETNGQGGHGTYGTGGGCTPGCYPIYSRDSSLGVKNPDTFIAAARWDSPQYLHYGATMFYRIDPANLPSSKSAQYSGSPLTLSAPSVPGSNRFTPASALVDSNYGLTAGLTTGLTTAWVYSTDGGDSWSTTLPSRTEAGTTNVICKYVLYYNGDTNQINMGYKMKHTSATSAATDDNYTITTTNVTLTVTGTATVDTAPTIKTGTSTYTGDPIQLISVKGKGKCDTVSESYMQYRLLDSAKTTTIVDWTTDSTKIAAKGSAAGTTYYVQYRAYKSGWTASTAVTSAAITIKKGTITLSGGGTTARTYNGSPQQLITTACTMSPASSGTLYYITTTSSTIPSFSTTTWKTSISDAAIKQTEPGTYYAYCYCVGKTTTGSAQYNNASKSLGSVKINKKEITTTGSTTPCTWTSTPYDGSPKSLITNSTVQGVGINSTVVTCTLEYAIGMDGATAPTSGWDTWNSESLKRSNKGTYYIWGRLTPSDTTHYTAHTWCYNPGGTPKAFSITTATTTIANPGLATGLKSTGGAQALVTGTVGPMPSPSIGTTAKFAVGDSNTTAPTSGWVTWGTSVPSELKRTNPADYYVWYKVESSNTNNATVVNATCAGKVTISKLTLTKNTPAVNTGDKFYSANTKVALITTPLTITPAGGGTIYYYVVQNNDFANATAPTFKQSTWKTSTTDDMLNPINPGVYHVYYYVVGKQNSDGKYYADINVTKIGRVVIYPSGATTTVLSDGNFVYAEGVKRQLIKTKATLSPSTGYTTYYCAIKTTTNSRPSVPTFSTTDTDTVKWRTSITDNALCPIEPGYYWIFFFHKGDSLRPNYGGTAFIIDKRVIWKIDTSYGGSTTLAGSPAGTLYYTGSAQSLITGVCTSSAGGTVKYAVGTSAGTAPTSGWVAWNSTVPDSLKQTNPGTYYVWHRIDIADSDHYNARAASLVGSVTINATPIKVVTNAQLAENLAYNSTLSQKLILSNATISPAGTGTIKFMINTSDTAPAANNSAWKAYSADEATFKKTDKGTYRVWCQVVSSNTTNYVSVAPYKVGTVVIEAHDAVMTKAPTPKDLTYNGTNNTNGTAQALLTAGTATNGTFQYSVTGANNDTYGSWSSTIPSATNAGTYKVKYYVKGSNGYNNSGSTDSPIDTITVVIKKKAIGSGWTAPTPIMGLTYNGYYRQLINAGSIGTAQGADHIEYRYYQYLSCIEWQQSGQYPNGYPVYTEAQQPWRTDASQITAEVVGTRKIKWRIIGQSNYADYEDEIIAEIGRGTAEWTTTTPTAIAPTRFTNADISLFAGAGTVKSNNSKATGTAYYRLASFKPDGSTTTTTYDESTASTYARGVWTTDKSKVVGKEVGTYTIQYKIVGANYSSSDTRKCYNDSAVVDLVAIIKLDPSSCTAPAIAQNLIYNTGTQQLLAAAATNVVGGTVYYRLVSYTPFSGTAVSYTETQKPWKTAITDATLKGTAAGTYVIKYKVVASTGYTGTGESQLSVVISKAQTTATAPTAATLIYTGASQQLLSAAGTAGAGGAMRYRRRWHAEGEVQSQWHGLESGARVYTETEWAEISGIGYNADVDSKEWIFEIEYWAATTNTNNYIDSEHKFVTVRMAKGTATWISGPTASDSTNLIYTGSAIPLLKAAGVVAKDETSGHYPMGKMRYKVDNGTWTYEYTNVKATTIGAHTVKYQVVNVSGVDPYHPRFNDSIEGEMTIEIRQERASVTTPPAPKTNLVYTGSAQTLITEGVAANGTIYYSLDSTTATNYKTGLSHMVGTNAKNYTVRYYVKGTGGYADLGSTSSPYDTFTVTISNAKADWQTTPGFPDSNLIFNNTNRALINSAGTAVAGTGTPNYRLGRYRATSSAAWTSYNETDKPWKTAYNDATIVGKEVGEYEVWYKVVGATNYDSTVVSKKVVTIGKATAAVGTKPTENTVTYTGSAQQLFKSAGTAGTGASKLQYRVSSYTPIGGTKTTYSETDKPWKDAITDASVKGTDAGTYQIQYRAVSANATNYNNSGALATLTAKINQAAVTGTAPTISNYVYDGGTKNLFKAAGAGKANVSKIQYRITKTIINGTTTVVNDPTGSDGWKTTYNDSTLQKKDVGSYEIQYQFIVDTSVTGNSNNYKNATAVTKTVSIGMGTATISTLATAKTGLKYTGSYQLLINAAVPTNGKVLYRIKNLNTDTYVAPHNSSGTVVTTNRYDDDGVVSTSGNWIGDASCVRALDIATYLVEYYVLGNSGYNNSVGIERVENIVIDRNTISITREPVGNTVKYTGSDQKLVLTSVQSDRGTPVYSMDGGTNWVNNSDLLVAKEVGIYTISWYVNGGDYYNHTEIKSFTAEIKKADGNSNLISKGSIAAITGLKYTGNPQQLFTGAGSVTGGGKIYYAVTTSSSTKPNSTNSGGSLDISTCTKTDAYNGTTQYTYYLWYRADASTSYGAVGWTYTGVNNKIGKATYSVSVSKNANVTYDGVAHQIFAGNPLITSDTHTSASWVTAKYTLAYTGFNGSTSTTGPVENAASLNSVVHAGTYTLTATLTMKTNASQIQAAQTTFSLAEFVISRASTANGIKVIGLNFDSSVLLGSDASVKPFNYTQAIDLTIGKDDLATYNGVTNENAGYNKLAYAFVLGNDEPSANKYTVCQTATNLNNAIKGLTANTVGTWNLWFKVVQHSSLTDAVYFKVATVTVNGFNANDIELTGLTMTGANAVKQNGSIVYDGKYHSLVASGAVTSANSNLHLGTIYYATGTSASVVPAATEWKTQENIEGLTTYADVGTYYLWVKWDADNGANVAASSGRVYAYMEITKLSQNNGNFYFSGIEFYTSNFVSATPTSTTGYKTYELTFKNASQRLVTPQPTISVYESKDSATNLAGDSGFGTFKLGVSTSESTMTGTYYTLDQYGSLTVREAGYYFLWVQWAGSNNVESGASVYKLDVSNNTKPRFKVNKLLDSDIAIVETVNLRNMSFVSDTSASGHPYQYNFEGNTYVPVSQALFEATNDPAIKINGSNYDTALTCQYLLTGSNDVAVVTNTTTGWVNSVELAKQTDVGTYYLWIKVIVNDNNVSVTRYFNLNSGNGAKIVKTSSFAQIAPTARQNITTNGHSFQCLIDASTQTAPLVEYSLGLAYDENRLLSELTSGENPLTPEQAAAQIGDNETQCGVYEDENGWKWTSNVNAWALCGIDSGSYTIYYRGSIKDENGNQYTMFDKQVASPASIMITISKANAAIKTRPVANSDIYYTGKAISTNTLFTNGMAQMTGSTDSIPLQYRWGDDTGTFYPYGDENLALTEAGTYVLYFKPNTTGLSNVNPDETVAMSITVQINQVDVQIETPKTVTNVDQKDLIYKGADYQVFLSPANYTLIDKDGNNLIVGSAGVSYRAYVNGDYIINGNQKYGMMGKVEYGYSTSVDVQPSNWTDDYTVLKVHQVGTYYVWLRVEAGDNHNSHIAQCFPDCAITVVPAGENEVRLIKSSYETNKRDAQGNVFRYDGTSHVLLKNLNLVVELKNFDNHGDPAWNYNLMPIDDRMGTLYYALTTNNVTAPLDNDFSVETGWHTNYQTLSKVQHGTYYLWVRIVNNDSNISTFNICLSELLDENNQRRETICINKAIYSDLRMSGVSGLTEMYTGADLSLENRKLAMGDLTVTVANSRYNLTEEIDWNQVRYFLWNITDSNGNDPVSTDYVWTTWNNTSAIRVGKYQLYVKLVVKSASQNIDTETQDLIYPLFITPGTLVGNADYCAEITRADEHYIDVVPVTCYDDLIYNGAEQRLIKEPARVVMQNGNPLIDDEGKDEGTAYYYISGSSTTLTIDGTTADNNWYADYASVNTELKQLYAGTYYIWVKFDQGDSHTAIQPRYIGSVTIAQASEQGIDLSAMELTQGVSYDGNLKSLVGKAVTQKFHNTGIELIRGVDYKEIYYAYSNDPLIAPTLWTTEDEIDDNIWKKESDLNDLQARNAGKYYIWIKVVSVENPNTHTVNVADYYRCYYNNPETDYAEIDKALMINDYFKGVNIHQGLSYIARNQILADVVPNNEGNLTIKISNIDVNTSAYNNDIVVDWGLGSGEDDADMPSLWVNSLNDINVMANNAGTYYLWIKVSGCKNINDYVACYAPVLIDKATIEYIVKPGYYGDGGLGHDALIYTGDYQTLLTNDNQVVVKFHPTGEYYDAEYYNANDVVIQYGVNTQSLGLFDYHDVVGLNATEYQVYYGVFEAANWYGKIEYVNVVIGKRDASDWQYGLSVAPYAIEDLEYNETEQDLIIYGRLVERLGVSGRGSALEGSVIEFWYAGENDNQDVKYRYYYDKNLGTYAWENNEILPGRTNAGTYYINYLVTGQGNYMTSEVNHLRIEIAKRRIWWDRNPEAIYGLKYSGEPQTALQEGRLYAGNKLLETGEMAKGVLVKYTIKAPGTGNRDWQPEIPSVNSIGLWDIYYYVDVDANNVFVGQENNDSSLGTLVQVLVERFVLTIRTAPESGYLMYTAEPQNLITYKSLSTDYTDVFAESDLPYFIYTFDRSLDESNWYKDNIKAINRGEYKIYYKLKYNPAIFELVGNNQPEGEVTARIQAMTFKQDSIRAIYNEETQTLSIETNDVSESLKAQITASDKNYVKFEYRKHDEYNPSTVWSEWFNTDTLSGGNIIPRTRLTLGTYQFRVIIQDDVNGNFYTYNQEGIEMPYEQVSITEDRVLNIVMPENTYTNLAYVRAWIDFTGTMLYEEAPEQFRHEGWVNSVDPLFYVFRNVNSNGRNGSAVVRVQTVNSGYYFRSTDDNYMSQTYRKQTQIDWTEEEDYVYAYQGLPVVEMTIRLYEVYHVQYDANGAVLLNNDVAPSNGWKWHGIDYLLEENVYKKDAGNNELLTPNGWNTTRSGNGNNYPNGSYYRENASQIFYANFFAADDKYFEIKWIITDGITTYRIARNSGKWYNVANYENREDGVFVKQGELITLPQIVEDEEHNKFWSGTLYGNYYIKGWYAANDDWRLEDGVIGDSWKNFEYRLNMTASCPLTFVAILSSRTEKGLECKFNDAQGNVVNSSGMIANGASAYMALSGMDAKTIKDYGEGYNNWVERYGNTQLTTTPTGFVEYNLGNKSEIETPKEEDDDGDEEKAGVLDDYMLMFIILGSGVITTIASLGIYIVMRRKNRGRAVNLKRFKEEKAGKNAK